MRIRWMLRDLLQNLGWPGMAAIALVFCALSLHFSAIAPNQAALAEMRALLAENRQTAGRPKPMKVETRLSPTVQLANFYAFFPDADSTPLWLGKIYRAANKEGLVLERGEYRLVADKNSRLKRYQIRLPARGGYLQVRRFINRALEDVPSLAVDTLSFQRQRIGDTVVDADIGMTLYLAGN